MAHLLGLQNVGFSAGSRVIFRDLSLGLSAGDRIGILGPNGAGKTTLARFLAGSLAPDSGEVTVTGGVQTSLLYQADALADATVQQVIHGDRPEHEWAAEAQIRQIHRGLLADISLSQPVANLSGGQRRRVALAKALIKPARVLILDEPTNHLDVGAVAWLAHYCQQRFAAPRTGDALVVVTHDRWFLDAVCSRIWEVVPGVDPVRQPQIPGRVETYEGGYAAFVLARAERQRLSQIAAEKRANLLRKELAWLQRGAPARTTKAKFRVDAAQQLIANEPPPRDSVELMKMATARLGKDVVDLVDVQVTYRGEDGENTVLKDVTWRLKPGERAGIVGANGSGKTTLLRLLEGTQLPTSGRVKHGKTAVVATLSQHTHELDEVDHLRVVEAVHQVRSSAIIGGKEMSAAQLVERLGFTKDRAWTPVRDLSGGERRRVQLLRLLLSEPNVLLLDEPTNDLDTDTLASLEDLLDSFPGTLVVVSHDRYLLERVTDHQLALLGDGQLRDLPGGVEQYLHWQEQRSAVSATQPETVTQASSVGDKSRVSGSQEHRLARKSVARLERQLEKVSQQCEQLMAQLEEKSVQLAQSPTDELAQQMADLSQQLQDCQSREEELTAQWMQAAEKLDE